LGQSWEDWYRPVNPKITNTKCRDSRSKGDQKAQEQGPFRSSRRSLLRLDTGGREQFYHAFAQYRKYKQKKEVKEVYKKRYHMKIALKIGV